MRQDTLAFPEVYPAEAYTEYEFGSPGRARLLLLQALHCDQALEDRFGYKTKFAHRLYLASFSVALRFQQGEFDQAALQAASLIRFVAGLNDTLEEPGLWEQSRIEQLPEGMRDFHLLQMGALWCRLLSALPYAMHRRTVGSFLAALQTANARPDHNGRNLLSKTGADFLVNLRDWLQLSLLDTTSGAMAHVSQANLMLRGAGSKAFRFALALGTMTRIVETDADTDTAFHLLEQLKVDVIRAEGSKVIRRWQQARMERLLRSATSKFPRQSPVDCLASSV